MEINTKIIEFAILAHHKTNHLYGGQSPYSVHLALVVSYAYKYIRKVPELHRDDVIHACWLHDTIEDARVTYNDVKEVAGETVANIVYAVTNEKGKTRTDRANDKYYQELRLEPFAVFVKMCDRLANAHYSVDNNSRMRLEYLKENKHFIQSLFGNFLYYEEMIDELTTLLSG